MGSTFVPMRLSGDQIVWRFPREIWAAPSRRCGSAVTKLYGFFPTPFPTPDTQSPDDSQNRKGTGRPNSGHPVPLRFCKTVRGLGVQTPFPAPDTQSQCDFHLCASTQPLKKVVAPPAMFSLTRTNKSRLNADMFCALLFVFTNGTSGETDRQVP